MIVRGYIVGILFYLFICCSSTTNRKVTVNRVDDFGYVRLDSILVNDQYTEVIMHILEGREFITYPPGTEHCYFIMDAATRTEYRLLRGAGITLNMKMKGPRRFVLTFERLDDDVEVIHLIGGRHSYFEGRQTTGFYDVSLGEKRY